MPDSDDLFVPYTVILNAVMRDEICRHCPDTSLHGRIALFVTLKNGEQACLGGVGYHIFQFDDWPRPVMVLVNWQIYLQHNPTIAEELMRIVKAKARSLGDAGAAIHVMIPASSRSATRRSNWLRQHGFKARRVAFHVDRHGELRQEEPPHGMIFEWAPENDEKAKAEVKPS